MKKYIDSFLIDENIIVCEGIRCLINKNKEMRVIGESYTAKDALQKMDHFHCDVIVLDISLDGGIELLNDLKRDYPRIPVLILSLHCEDSSSVRFIRNGAAGCICKTRPSVHLFEAIKKVIASGRYITERVALHLANQIELKTCKAPHTLLSNREFQVFQKLTSGLDNKEIASCLFLSPKTISTYKTRVLEKMGCNNIVELTHYALTENIN